MRHKHTLRVKNTHFSVQATKIFSFKFNTYLFFFFVFAILIISVFVFFSHREDPLAINFVSEAISFAGTILIINFLLQHIINSRMDPIRREGFRRSLEIFEDCLELWGALIIHNQHRDRIKPLLANGHHDILDEAIYKAMQDENALGIDLISFVNQEMDTIDWASGQRLNTLAFVKMLSDRIKEDSLFTATTLSIAMPARVLNVIVPLSGATIFESINFFYEIRDQNRNTLSIVGSSEILGLICKLIDELKDESRYIGFEDICDSLLARKNKTVLDRINRL